MLCMLLADGFEEIEAIAPLDVLRRCGIDVITVGITGKTVTGAHGIVVEADILPEQVEESRMEGIILPGGMPGTTNLQKNTTVQQWVQHCADEKKLLAAICAAPMILGEMGLLQNGEAVCFPGFEEHLFGATVPDVPVACWKNFITAKGAGAALAFGAAIADYVKKTSVGNPILAQMQTPGYSCD